MTHLLLNRQAQKQNGVERKPRSVEILRAKKNAGAFKRGGETKGLCLSRVGHKARLWVVSANDYKQIFGVYQRKILSSLVAKILSKILFGATMKKNLILILLILVAILGAGCKKDKKKPEPLLTVYSDVQERTPAGALVASKSGVTEAFKQAVDQELSILFADSSALGYVNKLNHADYVIYAYPDCTLSPETQTPSFKIRADNYDGTQFDTDPRPGIAYIYAAELVVKQQINLAEWTVLPQYVVCYYAEPDQTSRNAIRYGPEHIILFYNWLGKYLETETHVSSGHPLIEPRNPRFGARGENATANVVHAFGQIQTTKPIQ